MVRLASRICFPSIASPVHHSRVHPITITRPAAMPPQRATIAIPGHDLLVQITDDQSRTLVFPDSGVAYHSASGAVAETRHVYLENSGVGSRLFAGQSTSVLEIGLGTGLAMLMTVDAAIQSGTPLRFESAEYRVLSRDLLSGLQLEQHVSTPGLVESFLDLWDSLGDCVAPGRYRWQPAPSQEVWLHCGDVRSMDFSSTGSVDAIYFDPFAPSKNPEVWRPEFLRTMHSVLSADGRLVTYCVNRQVRESFQASGFMVQRVAGPRGGKREVMIATPVRTS